MRAAKGAYAGQHRLGEGRSRLGKPAAPGEERHAGHRPAVLFVDEQCPPERRELVARADTGEDLIGRQNPHQAGELPRLSAALLR